MILRQPYGCRFYMGRVMEESTLFFKSTFERLSGEKQEKIRSAAIKIFAENGYTNAKMKMIADEAGICVGSLYQYFETKEEVFLDAVQTMKKELESVLLPLAAGDGPFLEKVETVLRTLQRFSLRHPYVNKIYNEMTSEGNFQLSMRIAEEIESVSASCYRTIIETAKKQESFPQAIDERMFAFCLDNLFMMMQFSYSCEYYKERKKIYLGEEKSGDDEFVIAQMMRFIRGAFCFSG